MRLLPAQNQRHGTKGTRLRRTAGEAPVPATLAPRGTWTPMNLPGLSRTRSRDATKTLRGSPRSRQREERRGAHQADAG